MMPTEPDAGEVTSLPQRTRAFAVHVLTATGGALAMLALLDAVDQRWPTMFFWLGMALIVDGIDGTLARRFAVATVLPRWSGDVLDQVVDFFTYVIVPAYAIVAGGLLPPPFAVPLGLVIVVTSALYFADRRMKTQDNYFRGFPALWNTVAFYLFLLRPNPWVSALAVIVLAALTFMPVVFIHPMRVERLRTLNIALIAVWSVLAATALIYDFSPGPWVAGGLCAIGLYFVGAGLLRRPAPMRDAGRG